VVSLNLAHPVVVAKTIELHILLTKLELQCRQMKLNGQVYVGDRTIEMYLYIYRGDLVRCI